MDSTTTLALRMGWLGQSPKPGCLGERFFPGAVSSRLPAASPNTSCSPGTWPGQAMLSPTWCLRTGLLFSCRQPSWPPSPLLSSNRTAPSPEHPCFQASPSVKTMDRGPHTSFSRGLTCGAWGLGPSHPGAQTNTASVIWGHSHPILVVGRWWAGAEAGRWA